jgi:epoxyqueuosine reductase
MDETAARAQQELLRGRLVALGFDEVRFATLAELGGERLNAWIAAGQHADMHWMERTAEKRVKPALVLSEARSVVMLGVNYASDAAEAAPSKTGEKRATWARYALHEDYHDTIKVGLNAAGNVLEEMYGATREDYRAYVDTGPVLERGWAAKAGLGFIGKNAMLISRRHGNWLFLATILTRQEFLPDAPVRQQATDFADTGLLCGKCTRCLEACPTQAFAAPGVVDARRCVSYQTIENKGIIPRELRAGIGNRIYGCDVCLEVCPWNRFAQAGRSVLLVARRELAGLAVRGGMCEGGYVVFSVVDFVVKAKRGAPTYGEATLWFRDLRGRTAYEEHLKHDVVVLQLERGGQSYPTACMSLLGLRRLLTYLHAEAEPEFGRAFADVVREFM